VAAGISLVAALSLGVVAVAGPASAAPVVKVAYHVVGTSTIAKTNSVVKLGPTTIVTALNADATFSATMPLPPTSTSFNAVGLLPVSAEVTFHQVGQITGALLAKPRVHVVATSRYLIQLSNVLVAGIPTPVGSQCETALPVTIKVATPAGTVFDLTKGGPLKGIYTIGDFQNCGLTTTLINLLVPGPNNTVTLNLSNGHVVS
jgi:hypothetical protein